MRGGRRTSIVALWALLLATACGQGPAATPDAAVQPDAGSQDASVPLPIDVAADCNPLASTEECLFPFPSRYFQAADATRTSGVSNAFHAGALRVPPASVPIDYVPFNRPDGHSPSAPLLVHLGLDVDPTQLVRQSETGRSLDADAPIALFDVETGERVPLVTEMDQNLRDAENDGRHLLILRPLVPMRMGARHVAVLTSALRDADGAPIAAPAGFAALRDGTVTDHAALESSRPAFEELFTFLDAHGYPREDLLLAWDFVVASEDWVLGGILSMREQALAIAAEGGLGYTIDDVIEAPNANVLRIVEGTFEVPSFLDETNEIIRTDDGGATLQPARVSYPFTMIIPARAATSGPLPLVLFGHGVFGTGRDYLEGGIGVGTIQPLAESAGAVVIATDWIGLSSGDRDLLTTELVEDINQVNVITDRLQQALINNLVLVELARDAIQGDAQVRVDAGPLLTEDVYYYGVSLGGIQGASLVSLSPRITRAVLAVPGGAWASLLTRSIVYSPVRSLVDVRYPDPIVQQTFIALVQSRFDGSDGVNVGQLFSRRPLPDAPSERRLLLQEAIGDCQVPNLATRILARAMDVDLLEPSYQPVFGLDTVAAPTTRAAMVQLAMPDRLADYTPPDSNLLPSRDNGTHSDSIVIPEVIEQVQNLLTTGTTEMFCDGVCDPS